MTSLKHILILTLFGSCLSVVSFNILAQSKVQKTNQKYYDIANGVWAWHSKKETSLLLLPLNNTSQKQAVNNNLPKNKAVTNATSSLTPANSSTSTDAIKKINDSPKIVNSQQHNTIEQDNAPAKVDAVAAKLPSYREIKSQTNNLKNKSQQLSTKKESRPADPKLSKKPSNIAFLDTKKEFLLDNTDEQLKFVDSMNIGTETTISRHDFLTNEMQDLSIEYKTPNKLPTPNKISRTIINTAINSKIKSRKLKKLKGKRWDLGRTVQVSELENIKYSTNEIKDFKLLEAEPFDKYDIFMISAIIMHNKKFYAPALGLFDQLTESKKHKQEASFYMGKISKQFNLYSESAHRLVPLVLKPNEFRAEAIELLFKDFPKEHESTIALSLSKMENKETLPPLYMDQIAYYIAKHQFDIGKYKSARYTAVQVSTKSEFYEDAQFIKGLGEYLDKDLTQSVTTLSVLQSKLDKQSKTDKNIGSLVALNLGRIYFQLKKYKEAYHSYKRIHKSHPLWVQSMTELGWVQLALGDQFGSIGNMYSMHSPYFNSIYKPETYVIKTIGYLNICQYADAYKSLSVHEKAYRDWKTKIDSYMVSNGTPNAIYKTVSKYLGGKSTKDIDGLPHQVIREIARQKDFLNTQKNINSKIDESKNYSKILSTFKLNSSKVKKKLVNSKANLSKAKAKIALVTKEGNESKILSAKEELAAQKEYITSYYFQLRLFGHSRKKLNILKKNTQARIKKENSQLLSKASTSLFNHLTSIKIENNNLLDNNELLRYEIFSGSGENIRFQVSGGEVKNENRIPSSVKPKKSLNWDFSGEYWEDEIGSYRTTLVDKCPKN